MPAAEAEYKGMNMTESDMSTDEETERVWDPLDRNAKHRRVQSYDNDQEEIFILPNI